TSSCNVDHTDKGEKRNSGFTNVASGSTSQTTRNTRSSASCAPRTVSRPRRSCESHSRYCRLAAAAAIGSTFDMHFELLPERVEISVELRRVARLERGWPAAGARRETDGMIGLDLSGTAR